MNRSNYQSTRWPHVTEVITSSARQAPQTDELITLEFDERHGSWTWTVKLDDREMVGYLIVAFTPEGQILRQNTTPRGSFSVWIGAEDTLSNRYIRAMIGSLPDAHISSELDKHVHSWLSEAIGIALSRYADLSREDLTESVPEIPESPDSGSE